MVIWLDITRVCDHIFTNRTYYLLNHHIIDLLYTTLIATVHAFNELQAVSLFLAFDGTSTNTDHFTSGKVP